MTKKIYNLVRATKEQIELLYDFEKMVNLTRRQMTIHDKRKDINGLNIAIREGTIKPKNIKNIIEGERLRLTPFLKERDTAKAYHIIQDLSSLTVPKLTKIVVDVLGGKEGTIKARMRQHGPTLEEKKIICEFRRRMIELAFELVEGI